MGANLRLYFLLSLTLPLVLIYCSGKLLLISVNVKRYLIYILICLSLLWAKVICYGLDKIRRRNSLLKLMIIYRVPDLVSYVLRAKMKQPSLSSEWDMIWNSFKQIISPHQFCKFQPAVRFRITLEITEFGGSCGSWTYVARQTIWGFVCLYPWE